ncbi:uncharacterized protein BCR38DRAFT_213875 [Pseudomassariella vexata]|uniref:Carboxylesterase family protein n=1 Tax=Pseudomassariella vexata TaxID=1141098 RepID=A0A1Y2DZ72_9PEZI|nr:uncharacterized protein BCR38DRAFT_213875 [Pseudomassariella vexata]ORY64406.1 hypothetical protein BCR38DRAFT_213875 [Pseudomassariella vexata]
MARVAPSRASLNIFGDQDDTSLSEDDNPSIPDISSPSKLGNNRFAALGDVPVWHAHNPQSQLSKPTSSPSVESLANKFRDLRIAEPGPHGLNRVKSKPKGHAGVRLTRPPIGSTTFRSLETVPEDQKHDPSQFAANRVSDGSQHCSELSADQYAHHPLAIAARNLSSTQEQLTKHRDGNFEWVLTNMAVAEVRNEHETPSKAVPPCPEVRIEDLTPSSANATGEDDSYAEITMSRSPAKPAARIEDSFQALDQLEEQLEAFDEAALVKQVVSPHMAKGSTNSPLARAGSIRTTPQRSRPSPRAASATVAVKTAEPRRSPSIRKAASMVFLDSPKLKGEDKAPVQTPPKKSTGKGLASLQPPKQPAKSTKPPTVSTFELPGEAVARRLKEQREARLAMQAKATAEQPSASNANAIRRTKSAKAPTRPNFELPGEAISRRKREEREAKLKAQQEEERQRREFKARPVRSGMAPHTLPRETITSRARQSKLTLPENQMHQASPSPHKQQPVVSREPLSNADNQLQSRGRLFTTESMASQTSRATSSSTGSISGKRSSISIEETQQQRLRGKDVYQGDNSYAQERQREKREREALARIAREQAAERSRMLSREWAEKQKRKRMTVGSVRDLLA